MKVILCIYLFIALSLSLHKSNNDQNEDNFLNGRSFKIEEDTDQPTKTSPVLTFANGSLSFKGCNYISCSYSYQNNLFEMSDQCVSTEMACLQDSDQKYIKILQKVRYFEGENQTVIGFDSKNGSIIKLIPIQTLNGKKYLIHDPYPNNSETRKISMQFSGGRVNIKGCNQHSCSYVENGSAFSLENDCFSTKMYCMNDRDGKWISKLRAAVRVKVEQKHATFSEKSGRVILQLDEVKKD